MTLAGRDLFLPLFLLAFLACDRGGEEEKRVPSTVLEGILSSADEGRVELRGRKAPFTYMKEVIARDSLKEGRFRMKFRKEELGFLSFRGPGGTDELYLEPGDSLVLRKGLHGDLDLEGKGASRNRYIQEEASFKDSLGRAQDSIFKKGLEHFLDKLKERRRAYKAFRKRNFRDHGIEKRFEESIEARHEIELALMKFSYPDIYRYEHPNDSLQLSEDYWAFMDTLEMNDTLLLDVPEYLSFAYDVANKYALENRGQQRNKSYREMLFRTILDEFEGEVKDVVLTYFMLEQLRYNEERVKGSFMKVYRKEVSDSAMVRFVEKRLQNEEDPPS